MTTLIRNCTLAAAVFTSFAATAGNTVSVTAVSTADGAPISTDSGGHALIGFNGVQLEVDYAVSTLPAGQQAYIRALICDPFEDPAKMIYDWSTLQQSDANLTAADDSSCDGGLHFGTGYAISSPPATPGAQGIIGTERFALRMPPWVIPPGTLATVPVQLLSTDGTVLATASVTMANNSDPWWLGNQGLDVVDQAPQPDHSTNVTFRHWYGAGSYLPPTVRTNVYTPLDGGHIVSVQWTGPTSDQEFIDSQTWHTFWPRLMAQHPDTAPSTGAYGLDVAAPAGDGSVTATQNAATYGTVDVTVNYPPGSSIVELDINSDYAGFNQGGSRQADVSPAQISLGKVVDYHSLVTVPVVGGGTASIAPVGSFIDYSGVLEPGYGHIGINPIIIDRFPPEEELADLSNLDRMDQFGFTTSWSADPGCSPATTAWTDGRPDLSMLAQVRCLRWSLVGTTPTYFFGTPYFHLKAATAATLAPGQSLEQSNTFFATADNIGNGDPNVDPSGQWVSYSELHTWWNGQALSFDFSPSQGDHGANTYFLRTIVFPQSAIASNAHLSITLPNGFDWDTDPLLPDHTGLDADGNALTQSCTFVSAQLGAHPASVECAQPGDMVGLIYNHDNWWDYFRVRALAGAAGQTYQACAAVWVEPAGTFTGTYDLPATREHPVTQCTILTVSGAQSLEVLASANAPALMEGASGTFKLTLQPGAGAEAGTAGTHAYFYPGAAIDSSGNPIPFADPSCAPVQLTSLTSDPSALGAGPQIDCTTDSPPSPASNWGPCPTDLSTVTGVRSTPVDPYDGSLGVLSPGDGQQTIEIGLSPARGTAGQRVCAQGAASASGRGIATTNEVSMAITPYCVLTCPTNALACDTYTHSDLFPAIDGCTGMAILDDTPSPLPRSNFSVDYTAVMGDQTFASVTCNYALTDSAPTPTCAGPVHIPFTGSGQTYTPAATATDACDSAPQTTCDTLTFTAAGSQVAHCTSTNSFGQSAGCDLTVIADPQAPVDLICVGEIFAPHRDSFGTILFEDLWPSKGDLDFNDAVVAYNEEIGLNAANQMVLMQINISLLADGASLHNGLRLHLPVNASALAAATRTDASGTTTIANDPDESDLVIPLAADTRNVFARQDAFINTSPDFETQTAQSFSVRLTFTRPVDFDSGAAPFDLYLTRANDTTHQIHFAQYAGTQTMNTGLFGSADDRSDQDAHFIDENGLPFALAVPEVIRWPAERKQLDSVYPDVNEFAASGGTQALDWWQSTVELSNAFTQGQNGSLPPSPAFVGPRIAGQCHPLAP